MWISRFHVRNKSTVNFLIHFTNRSADRTQKSPRLSDILLLHHRTMCQFYAGLQKYKGGCNLVDTFAQCSKKIFTFVQKRYFLPHDEILSGWGFFQAAFFSTEKGDTGHLTHWVETTQIQTSHMLEQNREDVLFVAKCIEMIFSLLWSENDARSISSFKKWSW